MERTNWKTRNFQVYINDGEWNQIRDWVLRHEDIETGGDLFGLWIDEHTAAVQFVLGPGKHCRRYATSFFQDVEYLRKAGNYLTRHHGLCNIGQWHSHHRINLFKPSGGDNNTVWNNMPVLGLSRYIVFIANIKASGEVTVNCFLYEIKNGIELPVMHGEIVKLRMNSPFRLNEQLLGKIFRGAECFNQIDRYIPEKPLVQPLDVNVHEQQTWNTDKSPWTNQGNRLDLPSSSGNGEMNVADDHHKINEDRTEPMNQGNQRNIGSSSDNGGMSVVNDQRTSNTDRTTSINQDNGPGVSQSSDIREMSDLTDQHTSSTDRTTSINQDNGPDVSQSSDIRGMSVLTDQHTSSTDRTASINQDNGPDVSQSSDLRGMSVLTDQHTSSTDRTASMNQGNGPDVSQSSDIRGMSVLTDQQSSNEDRTASMNQGNGSADVSQSSDNAGMSVLTDQHTSSTDRTASMNQGNGPADVSQSSDNAGMNVLTDQHTSSTDRTASMNQGNGPDVNQSSDNAGMNVLTDQHTSSTDRTASMIQGNGSADVSQSSDNAGMSVLTDQQSSNEDRTASMIQGNGSADVGSSSGNGGMSPVDEQQTNNTDCMNRDNGPDFVSNSSDKTERNIPDSKTNKTIESVRAKTSEIPLYSAVKPTNTGLTRSESRKRNAHGERASGTQNQEYDTLKSKDDETPAYKKRLLTVHDVTPTKQGSGDINPKGKPREMERVKQSRNQLGNAGQFVQAKYKETALTSLAQMPRTNVQTNYKESPPTSHGQMSRTNVQANYKESAPTTSLAQISVPNKHEDAKVKYLGGAQTNVVQPKDITRQRWRQSTCNYSTESTETDKSISCKKGETYDTLEEQRLETTPNHSVQIGADNDSDGSISNLCTCFSKLSLLCGRNEV